MSDSKAPNDILRFMTYQESHYETPPTIAALDVIGKKGHIVLLEGIKTGTAKVSMYSIQTNIIALSSEIKYLIINKIYKKKKIFFITGFCEINLSRI